MRKILLSFALLLSALTAQAQPVPTVITEQPVGTLKSYLRAGSYIRWYLDEPYNQDGRMAQMVWADDGQTVYLQSPVTGYSNNAWIKGTVSSDGVVTFPSKVFAGLYNGTPQDPVITRYEEYEEGVDEEWGPYFYEGQLRWRGRYFDVDGNIINPDKVSYQLYIDDDQPYALKADLYEDLNEGGYGRIGVQAIYRGGGEEHRSKIVYTDDTTSDGPTAVSTVAAGTVRSQLFDLQGRRLQSAGRGQLVIRRTTGTDGSVTTKKILSRYFLERNREFARRHSRGTGFTDFAGREPQGGEQRLSQLMQEGKYTLVDFWASWCGPCRAAIPKVKALAGQTGERLQVLSVSVDRDRAAWLRAVGQEQMAWPQLLVPSSLMAQLDEAYRVTSIPFLVLISGEGRILMSSHSVDDIAERLR